MNCRFRCNQRRTARFDNISNVIDELHRAVLDVEAGVAEVFDGFDDAVAVAELGNFHGDPASEVVFVRGVAPDVDVADGGHVGDLFDG